MMKLTRLTNTFAERQRSKDSRQIQTLRGYASNASDASAPHVHSACHFSASTTSSEKPKNLSKTKAPHASS